MYERGMWFWVLILVSVVLVILLLAGQTLGVINYEQAVSLGLQESEEEVGLVGIAFAKGFGFGDTVVYIPLIVLGIVGLLLKKRWGVFFMMGAMAISVYWPLVHLYAIFVEREAITLYPEKYTLYPIVLGFIVVYGLWGMWYLYLHGLHNELSRTD